MGKRYRVIHTSPYLTSPDPTEPDPTLPYLTKPHLTILFFLSAVFKCIFMGNYINKRGSIWNGVVGHGTAGHGGARLGWVR